MLSNDLKSKINKLWDKFWSRELLTQLQQLNNYLFDIHETNG